ncbi:MAG: cyclic nucleotide-binding domain-containing protein [Chloroflexi bacterium]|nr:cyclic nucleotide-binding domain-containing protein [Chloroflexota bacterium]
MNILERLASIPLFQDLTDEELRLLASIARRERYAKGSKLCHQGELGTTFYIFDSGEAQVRRFDIQTGAEEPVGYKRPGDFFGETSLLLGEPRDATVRITADAEVICINKTEFDALREEHSRLFKNLRLSPSVRRKLELRRFPWMEPGETTAEFARKHWWVLVQLLFKPLIALLLTAIVLLLLSHIVPSWSAAFLVLLLISAAVLLGYPILDWRNDYYVVTNKRVVHEEVQLFVSQTRDEAPLDKIQNVTVERRALGNLIGFGDVVIQTAGPRGLIMFRYLCKPEQMMQSIFEEMNRAKARARAEERREIRQELQRQFGWSEEAPPAPIEPRRRYVKELSPLGRVLLRIPHPWVRSEVGETVTWRKHPVFLLQNIAFPLLGLVALVAVAALVGKIHDSPGPGFWLGYMLVVAIVVFLLWYQYVDWGNDIYMVTADALIDVEKKPLFGAEQRRRAGLEMVQNISLDIPGVWGMLLDFGDVVIQTAGVEGSLIFTRVSNPREVQADIVSHIEAFRERQARAEAERRRAELSDWFVAYREILEQKERSQASQAKDKRKSDMERK